MGRSDPAQALCLGLLGLMFYYVAYKLLAEESEARAAARRSLEADAALPGAFH